MLLGASSQSEATNPNLNSVTSAQGDPGVPHGDYLRRLTEAAISGDWLALGEMRADAEAAMGEQRVVDTLIVAAAFNGITRVADATGIPLDDSTAMATEEMRIHTGIENFEYEAKSARYA